MPVRIYDISKKLGLENKEIIAKAKLLGIAAAKVASSSLDKISAEWLEEELLKSYPEVAARLAPKAPPEPPKPAPVEEKIILITAPPPPPAPEPEPLPELTPATEVESPAPQVKAEEPSIPVVPITPAAPPVAKIGDKVGFIQLAPRPQPRGSEKPGLAKLPPPGPVLPRGAIFARVVRVSARLSAPVRARRRPVSRPNRRPPRLPNLSPQSAARSSLSSRRSWCAS